MLLTLAFYKKKLFFFEEITVFWSCLLLYKSLKSKVHKRSVFIFCVFVKYRIQQERSSTSDNKVSVPKLLKEISWVVG